MILVEKLNLPDKKKLVACYHQVRNVNTGQTNIFQFTKLFQDTIDLVWGIIFKCSKYY